MRVLRSLFVCSVLITPGMCRVAQSGTDERVSAADSAVPSVQQAVFSKDVEMEQGWRRTDQGWVQTADWTVSSSGTDQAQATRLHPSLIAAFILLVSTGALLAFEPLIRRSNRGVKKSDQALIQSWGRRMRHRTRVSRRDCL